MRKLRHGWAVCVIDLDNFRGDSMSKDELKYLVFDYIFKNINSEDENFNIFKECWDVYTKYKYPNEEICKNFGDEIIEKDGLSSRITFNDDYTAIYTWTKSQKVTYSFGYADIAMFYRDNKNKLLPHEHLAVLSIILKQFLEGIGVDIEALYNQFKAKSDEDKLKICSSLYNLYHQKDSGTEIYESNEFILLSVRNTWYKVNKDVDEFYDSISIDNSSGSFYIRFSCFGDYTNNHVGYDTVLVLNGQTCIGNKRCVSIQDRPNRQMILGSFNKREI